MPTKYVHKETSSGRVSIPMTDRERFVDRAFTWIGRLLKIGGYLLLIALVIGYVSTCSPFWFQPFMNAPLICVGAR